MSPDHPRSAYQGESARTRAHVALRWRTAPLRAVVELVPPTGSVLDWGCGHGLVGLLLAAEPGRRVRGVDVDADKVAVARRAAGRAGVDDRFEVEEVGPDATPSGSWDAVVVVDVLYLLDPSGQERLVRSAVRSLAPGGVLVVKEMGTRPRWKAAANRLQEQVAVRVGLTRSSGGRLRSPDPADVVAWCVDEGLEARATPVDRGYHCPHVAVVAQLRAGAPRPPARP